MQSKNYNDSTVLLDVGFEVLTAVAMKNTIFWDIMTCSPIKAKLAACFMLVSYLA
jgi:hypothetical protein